MFWPSKILDWMQCVVGRLDSGLKVLLFQLTSSLIDVIPYAYLVLADNKAGVLDRSLEVVGYEYQANS